MPLVSSQAPFDEMSRMPPSPSTCRKANPADQSPSGTVNEVVATKSSSSCPVARSVGPLSGPKTGSLCGGLLT